MQASVWSRTPLLAALLALIALAGVSLSQPGPEDFEVVRKRMEQAKPAIQKKHADLLSERYDLADRPANDVKMSHGKAVQAGTRAKLPGDWTFGK